MPSSWSVSLAACVATLAPLGALEARAQTGAGGQGQQVVLPPAAMPVEEASALASGWVLLAEGKAREAAAFATEILARHPNSAHAIGFAIEADIAARGPRAALARYEGWLAAGPEEPGLVRRIARAILHEWGRQTGDPALRVEALEALTTAGEPGAHAALVSAANDGGIVELGALAALGDENAVRALVDWTQAEGSQRHRAIEALGRSRSPLAVAPLANLLGTGRDEHRVAAAAALGKLGQQSAIEPLKGALNDPRPAVRIEAAGALYALGDFTGYDLLTPLLADPNAQVRLSGVALLASRPDSAWALEAERVMRSAEDPYVRLEAAKLLAPFNPDAARPVIRSLLNDPNPAVRDAAGPALAEVLPDDLTALRQLLNEPGGHIKVRAAARILDLTR